MRRTRTGAVAVAAVLFALAATVLASRGDPGDRTAAAFEAAAAGRTLFLSILGVAFVICAALAVWALWPDGSGASKAPPPFRWLPYLVVAALIVVLAFIAPERPPRAATEAPAASSAPGSDGPDGEPAPGLVERASPTASLTLAALAVAALVAWTVVRRRRAPGGVDGEAGAAPATGDDGSGNGVVLTPDLVAELDDGDLTTAVAAIEAEPDARRAVVLAYAVLDARLRGSPAERPRSATPHEWLARIRRVHAADAPEAVEGAQRLTTLYERARFAAAPMAPDDRDSAARSVAMLRALPSREGAR